MFKKILSKVGIGSASVNLVLSAPGARVGEEITGTLILNGNSTDTQVDALLVNLYMYTLKDEEETERLIDSVRVATNLQVRAGETIEIPFRYILPVLPESGRFVKYQFHSSLDIPGAVDKHDFDDFAVWPSFPVAVIQETLEALGFKENHESGEFDGHYQEFEYNVVSGHFRGRIKELEVIYLHEEHGIRLHIELEKKSHGLSGYLAQALEMEQEAHNSLLVPFELIDNREELAHVLARFLEDTLHRAHLHF